MIVEIFLIFEITIYPTRQKIYSKSFPLSKKIKAQAWSTAVHSPGASAASAATR